MKEEQIVRLYDLIERLGEMQVLYEFAKAMTTEELTELIDYTNEIWGIE